MKLRVSAQPAPHEPKTVERRLPVPRGTVKPVLIADYLTVWKEKLEIEIDGKLGWNLTVPRSLAVRIPEHDFAYLLTLLYRLLSRSPHLGEPSFIAGSDGEGIALSFVAEKKPGIRLPDRDLLGASAYFTRLIDRFCRDCSAIFTLGQTDAAFSVTLTLAPATVDLAHLLSPLPDQIAQAVKAAMGAVRSEAAR